MMKLTVVLVRRLHCSATLLVKIHVHVVISIKVIHISSTSAKSVGHQFAVMSEGLTVSGTKHHCEVIIARLFTSMYLCR